MIFQRTLMLSLTSLHFGRSAECSCGRCADETKVSHRTGESNLASTCRFGATCERYSSGARWTIAVVRTDRCLGCDEPAQQHRGGGQVIDDGDAAFAATSKWVASPGTGRLAATHCNSPQATQVKTRHTFSTTCRKHLRCTDPLGSSSRSVDCGEV